MRKEYVIVNTYSSDSDDEAILLAYLNEGYSILSAMPCGERTIKYILERDNISKQVFG